MSQAAQQPVLNLSPAEVRNWGGFTRVADDLTSLLGTTVTRQRVYSWWRWRRSNHFPERRLVKLPDGREKQWFDLRLTRAWAQWRGIGTGNAHQQRVPRGNAPVLPRP